MIDYNCSHCGRPMSSPYSQAGELDKCSACGGLTAVPGDDVSPPANESLRLSGAGKPDRDYSQPQPRCVHCGAPLAKAEQGFAVGAVGIILSFFAVLMFFLSLNNALSVIVALLIFVIGFLMACQHRRILRCSRCHATFPR